MSLALCSLLHVIAAGGGGEHVRKSQRHKAPTRRALASALATSPTRSSARQQELLRRGIDPLAVVRLAADDALLQQDLGAAVAGGTAASSLPAQRNKKGIGEDAWCTSSIPLYVCTCLLDWHLRFIAACMPACWL